MQNTKELSVQEMKQIIGGDSGTCAANIAVGALTGGAIGAIGGVFTGCVEWGYNETPQHGWH